MLVRPREGADLQSVRDVLVTVALKSSWRPLFAVDILSLLL